MAGGVVPAPAAHAADGVAALWVLFVAATAIRPAGLMVLAAVTLTCLLLALLAQGGRIAAVASALPQASRTAGLREKSWRVAFVPQRDPDAPGRARPRAPSVSPAAA
ncbi:MAG: DUF6412 domain-containing protein [Nocardiopsaceae bacterium]|jgi:hypothetical protein|nr:DUF6412 domain-containing protein [Nocardiopsaceae bacterium]